MKRKIGLFLLSMWLFFVLTIIITGYAPICISNDCHFIGWQELISKNIISILCLIGIITGVVSYFDFSYELKSSTNMPFLIDEVENINYEHLTFLTTYIVPLVCFNFAEFRYHLVLLILMIVICAIYVKTDLFYANPTLALLGFKIFNINGSFENNEKRNGIILITKHNLKKGDRCDYIKLDNRIFYTKLK
ncbi:hypothetical protein DU508_23225 [Pedobacter chinensis]|uniref:Uncharacterized protein n=1 Tax=Pedobacter chinensis TaxID=2282421 RepID=A0A369PT56_9SPHI|nr:anti-phage protein KwaA [Pedobacter chinensis]RDC54147.1 hypothetical protein DU508_23225 [Pedobacter chinensis]